MVKVGNLDACGADMGFELRVWGSEFRASSLGFRVSALESKLLKGLGFGVRVESPGFRDSD